MAIASEISQLFNSPQVVPLKQWVDKTTEQYPYFALPLLLLVKRDSGNHDEALQRLAVMSPDRRDLSISSISFCKARNRKRKANRLKAIIRIILLLPSLRSSATAQRNLFLRSSSTQQSRKSRSSRKWRKNSRLSMTP